MATIPSMSCPSGGTFYACAEGSRFVGCCTANPCGSNGCPAGNLEATSMDAAQFNKIPDEDCDSRDAQFYTCTSITPTFWGCCKTNPCSSGCAAGSLAGAQLKNGQAAMPYLQAYNSSFVDGGSTSTSSASSSGSAATQSSSPSSTPASSTPASTPQSSGTNIGAIAGGAVGGFAVLALLIFGIIFLFRRRRSSSKSPPSTNIESQPPTAHQPESEMKQPQDQGEANTAQYDAGDHLLTKNAGGFVPNSPQPNSSYPNSPQPPYSPGPPSYWDEQRAKHVSYELAGSPGGQELESGQMYHPYRSV